MNNPRRGATLKAPSGTRLKLRAFPSDSLSFEIAHTAGHSLKRVQCKKEFDLDEFRRVNL
jgi:hypothetical protein